MLLGPREQMVHSAPSCTALTHEVQYNTRPSLCVISYKDHFVGLGRDGEVRRMEGTRKGIRKGKFIREKKP